MCHPVLLLKSPRIPVAVPSLFKRNASDCIGNTLHHPFKAITRTAIGQFLVLSAQPMLKIIIHCRCTHDDSPAHMPHMPGKVVHRYPFAQCAIEHKQILPGKAAITQYTIRQYGKRTAATEGIEAEVSLNLYRIRFAAVRCMKAFADIKTMLPAVATVTSRTAETPSITCPLVITNRYFHSSGRDVAFLLLFELFARGKNKTIVRYLFKSSNAMK